MSGETQEQVGTAIGVAQWQVSRWLDEEESSMQLHNAFPAPDCRKRLARRR